MELQQGYYLVGTGIALASVIFYAGVRLAKVEMKLEDLDELKDLPERMTRVEAKLGMRPRPLRRRQHHHK